MTEQIDTVVRFHDVRRLPELQRCVFSLVGQSHQPVRIVLALQRFSDADIAATKAALAPYLASAGAPELAIVNYQEPEPKDARSVLLGLGADAATGRYLAFLDYDDVLYPEAYEMLIARLRRTGAAIVFASVRVMRVSVYPTFMQTKAPGVSFRGRDLLDLFRKNFCPLHSYVMDRSRIAPEDLTFDPSLIFEEDYDVLLRVCAHLPSDFGLIGTKIGDYYAKDDGSNTVPFDGVLAAPVQEYWERHVVPTIERRRQTTMVAVPIQRALGLHMAAAPISVRDLLNRFPSRVPIGRPA